MKLKYYVVEYIDYLANDRGFPSSEVDDRTFRRRRFDTKKQAKRFIKKFLNDDAAFKGMWLAKLTLHKVVEKVKVINFDSSGYKDGIAPHSFQPDDRKGAVPDDPHDFNGVVS